jgi:hypothetical protein
MRFCMGALAAGVILFGAASSSAQICDEHISLVVSEGSIAIAHNDVQFNCCAWIDVVLSKDDSTIEFTEREMFEFGPCFCTCCFDMNLGVGGLEPGEYTVRVWKALDNFDGTWTTVLAGEWMVAVQGSSPPFVRAEYLPCGEARVPDDGGTPSRWGTIKALYR